MNKTKPAEIIIVDNHPILRQGLRHFILQNAGQELSVSAETDNAADALEIIENHKPDAVITDIALKGRDGIELIKMIRAQYPDLPILVFSMHDELIYAERSFRAGANGYIMKQEASENIVDALQTVLRGEMYASSEVMEKILLKSACQKSDAQIIVEDALSNRELEVYRLLGGGRTTMQIAEELFLSRKTIETHCQHIKSKLLINNFNKLIQNAVIWTHSWPQN